MTDIEKNKLFVEQQTSTENPQETPAAMVKANDEEAQDKNEMPVENDKFEFFADIVCVVLRFFMGIMFILQRSLTAQNDLEILSMINGLRRPLYRLPLVSNSK
mmetsp:Transcript_17834/g.26567  ORF Transcript_17834/g.26567 Transcript_17834/m.26567 type:complete len:103 (+) Transcript_17834:57-365(+)